MNDCITTTKQCTTKLCAYFLGYTVYSAKLPSGDCHKTSLMITVNIGSGNGMVPAGNNPISEPMLTQISVATWRHSGVKMGIHLWRMSFPLHPPGISSFINSLGPNDAICCWGSWSTLVQVMACCLTAPSHYLNQCWLIINKGLWYASEDIIIRRFEVTN